MKRALLTLFIVLLAVGLMANDAFKVMKSQPKVFKAERDREEVVVSFQDFEDGMGDWYSHDGTQPTAWWHLDDFMVPDGSGLSWWMGDTTINGYIDHIYVVLDTDEITVPANGHLTFDMALWCEGLGSSGDYDGWDGANIRISTDNGETWDVIDGYPAYNSTSMYSFGNEHGEGPGVAGWGGSSNSESGTDLIEGATADGWINADFDLSAYAGDDVRIRFAFASDPAYNTADDGNMFGFMVDNIMLGDFENTGTEDGVTPSSMVPVAGDIWYVGEPGDAPSPTHAAICQNDAGSYNPGMLDYLYSGEIELPEADQIWADFKLKGSFFDQDTFPEVDYFGWEISPDGGTTWYAMSNPYGDPDGDNYVYSDAPEIWASMIESYTLDGMITEYGGQTVQFRIYFQTDQDTPEGTGIMVDDFTVNAFIAQGPEPTDLTAEVNYENNTVELNWIAPELPGEGWMHYDSGENVDGIGTGGAAVFAVAARWMGTDFVDGNITSIKFFPREATASYTLKIWQGASASNEIYSQAVPTIQNEAWNEIELDTPVAVSTSQELWIGYEIDTPTGYPAGCDGGPAVAGWGDMIQFEGGWSSMAEAYGLDYNWNIQGYLAARNGETVALNHNSEVTRELTGYNIYRSAESGTAYELIDTVDSDALSYTDSEPMEGAMNYYVVTASYDNGDSAYSNEASAFVPPSDLVEVMYDDGTAEDTYNVGPAKTMLVKFTPGYSDEPLQIKFLKVYIETVNTGQVVVSLYDDDGVDGMPGTAALFNMMYPASNLVAGWNYIPIEEQYQAQATFTEGAFYLGILEMAGSSNYGLDTDNTGRTYNNVSNSWEMESTGNVMFRAITQNAIIGSEEEEIAPANVISLTNYPNPFNPVTKINFNMPQAGDATLKIYNTKGQLINTLFDGQADSGNNELIWNGVDNNNKAVSSGLYFYKLETSNKTITNKMMLLK